MFNVRIEAAAALNLLHNETTCSCMRSCHVMTNVCRADLGVLKTLWLNFIWPHRDGLLQPLYCAGKWQCDVPTAQGHSQPGNRQQAYMREHLIGHPAGCINRALEQRHSC